jgi:hypothetical protein
MGHPSVNSSIGPIYTLVARIAFRETQKAPTRPGKRRTSYSVRELTPAAARSQFRRYPAEGGRSKMPFASFLVAFWPVGGTWHYC